MDGESSCESDISESWSLIDINLNEESLSVAESCSEIDKNSEFDLKNKKSSKTELEDFVRKCKEINKTDFSGISDSDSDASFKNHGLPNCNTTEVDGINCPFKRNSDHDEKHDSADAESIEILDEDESEIGRLDASNYRQFEFPTYRSDDEESLEGNIYNENKSINSAVIKRRVFKSSEETVHSVNSESISSGVGNSTSSSIDTKKVSQKLGEESEKPSTHAVYKHYRNNVANTILSLSVGLIFAGVACIAIGHFLGVQNASDSAVELAETLKKLQVENAALQSRLLHLNRALLNREANSEIEMPLNEPQSSASSEQTPSVDPLKNHESGLSNVAVYEIRSSLNSIEWLSKLEEYVRKNNKVTDTEYGIDFNVFRKFIHDELYTLNGKQDDGVKILKETDKISKILQKVINKLSSSQDHIEKLYERLVKFKNKFNYKVKRIFPESSKESESERAKFEGKVPVTELDLQVMNWDPKNRIQKSFDPLLTHSESDIFYKFPQPENYYQKEKDSVRNTKKKVEKTNSGKEIKNKDFEKPGKVESRNKKKYKKANERKEDKWTMDSWKKNGFNERKINEKKGDKKRKRNASKIHKVIKNLENDLKNKDKIDESKQEKVTDKQNVFNETTYENKKYSKKRHKEELSKRMLKKFKNSKLRKVLLSKVRKGPYFHKKPYNVCYGPECYNLTGYWMFKWAGGRQEIRRLESLGDWQFARAKMRRDVRENEGGNSVNWQFKRAKERENNRNLCKYHGKCSKYNKDFFHEGFSWF